MRKDLTMSGTFSILEISKGRYAIIKKRISHGWVQVATLRSEVYAKEMVYLLNTGMAQVDTVRAHEREN